MLKDTAPKLLSFAVYFSLGFLVVKIIGIVPSPTLSDASSLGWLYSVTGVIFGVISGFVIQMKWSIWDRLVESLNGEVTNIRQLHSLIHHLPEKSKEEIESIIKAYLRQTIEQNGDHLHGSKPHKTDKTFRKLEESIYKLYEDEEVTHIDSIAYDLFRKTMDWREKRMNFSHEHLHPAIRLFILSNALLMAVLSVLLPVQSLWLDYVFTLSISILTYGVYLLIDDLDHPFRPGNWHLSTKGFAKLLSEMTDY